MTWRCRGYATGGHKLAYGRREKIPRERVIGFIGNLLQALEQASSFIGSVLREAIDVVSETWPRVLLGVLNLRNGAQLGPEDLVDIPEGLLEHDLSPRPAITASNPKGEEQVTASRERYHDFTDSAWEPDDDS